MIKPNIRLMTEDIQRQSVITTSVVDIVVLSISAVVVIGLVSVLVIVICKKIFNNNSQQMELNFLFKF